MRIKKPAAAAKGDSHPAVSTQRTAEGREFRMLGPQPVPFVHYSILGANVLTFKRVTNKKTSRCSY
jgi:hypothetical protein